MSRGVRWIIGSSVVLVTLAGCGRSYFSYETREPWRREAEMACLNSGTVKEDVGLVKISPIEGPGICGMDFPLKVSALGENQALGYLDEPIRPPGSIPGVNAPAAQPRWPIAQQPSAPPSYAPPNHPPPPPQPSAPMSIEAPGTAPAYPQQQYLGAPPSDLRAPPDWRRID